jgi:hypothetical protein
VSESEPEGGATEDRAPEDRTPTDGQLAGKPVRRGRVRTALTRVGRGGARAGRAGARGAGWGVRRLRRATHAQGAGESGLAKLIELHGLNAAGDALVAVSLANTLFFAVPVGEARGRVALYLLITMAPFALMAPVVGPVLDRLRGGRRYAVAATMLVRAVLCWVMAEVVATGELTLYPAAFGCLVCSKSYGVTRSAAVPRLLPAGVSLVRANSRISLAGLFAGTVAAGIGSGLALIGPPWSLRLGFVVFTLAAGLAVALPRRVDSAAGEERADFQGTSAGVASRRFREIGTPVLLALRANATLRAFSGFLLMFLAFLLREEPIGGLKDTAAIGLVAGAAGLGAATGTTVGAWLRARAPEVIVTAAVVVVAVAAGTGAWFYGLASVIAIALSAGFAQSLGKLSLDALLQRDVAERVRTSAFARSETLLQLSWVAGGGLGIVLPLRGDLGLGLAAAGLAVMAVFTTVTLRSLRRQRRNAASGTPPAAPLAGAQH